MLFGTEEDQYRLFPSWLGRVKAADSHNYSAYDELPASASTGGAPSLHRCFIAPGISRRMVGEFSSEGEAVNVRYLATFDAAHSRAKKLSGVIPSIHTYDANDCLVTLAFGYFSVENTDNWTWFLSHFRQAYPRFSSHSDLVAVTDGDKGISAATQKVWECVGERETIVHKRCCFHLAPKATKMTDTDKGMSKKLFWAAAKSPTSEGVQKHLAALESINPDGASYLCELGIHNWAGFHGTTWGRTTSQGAESFNSTLSVPRQLSVPLMCDYLLHSIQSNFAKKKAEYEQLRDRGGGGGSGDGDEGADRLMPSVRKRMREEAESCKNLAVRSISSTHGEVSSSKSNATYHTIDLRNPDMLCSCGETKRLGYPCGHLHRFLLENDVPVGPYVASELTVEAACEMYGRGDVGRPICTVDMTPVDLAPPVCSSKTKGRKRIKGDYDRLESDIRKESQASSSSSSKTSENKSKKKKQRLVGVAGAVEVQQEQEEKENPPQQSRTVRSFNVFDGRMSGTRQAHQSQAVLQKVLSGDADAAAALLRQVQQFQYELAQTRELLRQAQQGAGTTRGNAPNVPTTNPIEKH